MTLQITGTPAYAVTANPDGTVTVAVNRIGDPADANEKLRDTGAGRMVIMPPSPEDECPIEDRGKPMPTGLPHEVNLRQMLFRLDPQDLKPDDVLRIKPDEIPEDALLVLIPVDLTVRFGGGAPEAGDDGPALTINWYATPGPKCVLDPFPVSQGK